MNYENASDDSFRRALAKVLRRYNHAFESLAEFDRIPLTKQGVRDLNCLPSRERENVAELVRRLSCEHNTIELCCDGMCGHLHCPGCGITWDEYAEGSPRLRW